MRRWKALKTPKVHGTIQRTTRMLGVRCAARLRPATWMFVARRSRISASFGSVQRTSSPDSHLTGTGTRHGLSLARNSAFATITRSTFPTCTFATTQDNFANPFDLRLLRSASVSRPIQGDLIAGYPFFTFISRALTVSTASTPLWAIAALRIKAFNRSNRQKLTLPNARYPSAPRRTLFQSRVGSKLPDSLSSCSANRSVNPGTGSIMT